MRRGNRDRVVQNRCVAVDRSGPWKMGLVDALAESLQRESVLLAASGVDKSQTMKIWLSELQMSVWKSGSRGQ